MWFQLGNLLVNALKGFVNVLKDVTDALENGLNALKDGLGVLETDSDVPKKIVYAPKQGMDALIWKCSVFLQICLVILLFNL